MATTYDASQGPRIGRLMFWLSLAFVVSGALALSTFVEQNLGPSALGASRGFWHGVVWITALVIAWMAALRRLRDRGRSALWLVPFIAGPLTAEAIAVLLRGQGVSAPWPHAASFISLVLTLWALIELGLMPGLARGDERVPAAPPPRRTEGEDDAVQGTAATSQSVGGGASRAGRPRAAGGATLGSP